MAMIHFFKPNSFSLGLSLFMSPTSKKLRRHIGLGLSIRAWCVVRGALRLAYGKKRLEIGFNNNGPFFYFFSVRLVVEELWPFFNVYSTFPMEPCEKISRKPLEL